MDTGRIEIRRKIISTDRKEKEVRDFGNGRKRLLLKIQNVVV